MIRIWLTMITTGFLVLPPGWAQSFHTAKAKSPAAGTVFIYPERVRLKLGPMVTVQRGLMFVPINRSKPDSDVIAVEFYRLTRSAQADPKTPPIFKLYGGPGFGGLQETLSRPGNLEAQFAHLLAVSDVVVVGQRGIGSSKPDTVIDETDGRQAADKPLDESKAVEDLQRVLKSGRDYWIEQGVDLSGFNVLEMAADVKDIAEALGYEKIIIEGGSFGSHLGIALIRNYRELVARAVLTGMEGPDHTWDHPGHLWNVYKRVAEEAEAANALKDLIPEGGLIAAMEAIASKVAQEPIIVTLQSKGARDRKVVVDAPTLQRYTRELSIGLGQWPAEVIAMHRGDFERPARYRDGRSRFKGREMSTASSWMLDSGSGITAKRRAEYESDPAMKIVGSTFWNDASGSPVWQADLGDDFRTIVETEVPTVIIHGTWDRRTPYENATELAPYFLNHKLITVKRGTHGALGEATRRFPSFRPALMKFMATGDMSDLPEELELPVPNWVVPKGQE